MSKLSDMIDAAGARADSTSGFVKEAMLDLESRIEALEANAQIVPRAAPDPAAASSATTSKLQQIKAELAAVEAAVEAEIKAVI